MYRVLLERRAQRDIRGLPQRIADRLIKEIKSFAANPRPVGCRKLVGSKNDWRMRVGDYRIIYEVDDPQQEVRVMYVRHRRDAYR